MASGSNTDTSLENTSRPLPPSPCALSPFVPHHVLPPALTVFFDPPPPRRGWVPPSTSLQPGPVSWGPGLDLEKGVWVGLAEAGPVLGSPGPGRVARARVIRTGW